MTGVLPEAGPSTTRAAGRCLQRSTGHTLVRPALPAPEAPARVAWVGQAAGCCLQGEKAQHEEGEGQEVGVGRLRGGSHAERVAVQDLRGRYARCRQARGVGDPETAAGWLRSICWKQSSRPSAGTLALYTRWEAAAGRSPCCAGAVLPTHGTQLMFRVALILKLTQGTQTPPLPWIQPTMIVSSRDTNRKGPDCRKRSSAARQRDAGLFLRSSRSNTAGVQGCGETFRASPDSQHKK